MPVIARCYLVTFEGCQSVNSRDEEKVQNNVPASLICSRMEMLEKSYKRVGGIVNTKNAQETQCKVMNMHYIIQGETVGK